MTQKPLQFLLVHQNFPGQFRHIAPALQQAGHNIIALGSPKAPGLNGIRLVRWQTSSTNTPNLSPFLVETESKLIRGEATARAALALRAEGFVPDIIYAHPGWGEALFLQDIFPKARLVIFHEFYYHGAGQDVNFDPEFSPATLSPERLWHIRMKNTALLNGLVSANLAITPTEWQKQTAPRDFHGKISTIHDGVDTARLSPNLQAELRLANGTVLRAGENILTYVARNLEPYRGFHIFMRSLPEILNRSPDTQVVICGAHGVSYGAAAPHGKSWFETLRLELGDRIDWRRVHVTGSLPYDSYRALLQVSRAHVYLTYPFVLSWSLMEAMASGCAIIASNTAPVTEVIAHGHNGLLVPFFDTGILAETCLNALEHPETTASMRRAARETILARYDLQKICLPQQLKLLTA